MLTLRERPTTKTLTKTAVLSVIAFLIMFIEFPLAIFPQFLKIDLSDIPALIGAFALGPMAGVVIELVKNILHGVIKGSSTMGVGELANFVVGSAFVYAAGIVYYKNKTFKSALIGMGLGIVTMTIVAAIANYFVLIPFYAKLFNMPIDAFVSMAGEVNKYVVDFKTFIILSIVPFNLIKGVIVVAITMVLYKRISPILHK